MQIAKVTAAQLIAAHWEELPVGKVPKNYEELFVWTASDMDPAKRVLSAVQDTDTGNIFVVNRSPDDTVLQLWRVDMEE